MLTYIDINRVYPHPDNPRKDLGDLTELAASIKANGILQNLTVVPYDDDYMVVIGHRRLAAAKMAGLTEVPCVVSQMTLQEQVGTMLLENIQRNDLTVLEQAEGFQMMLDLGESVKSIAGKTGFSEATVRHRIKLNELDKKKLAEASVRGGRIEDYIALEKIENPKARNTVLEHIGTHNFKWQLEQALDEQEKPKRKKALIAKLDVFATKIKESEANGLAYATGFYGFKGNVPEPVADVEYFYTVSGDSISLYKKAPEAAHKEKTSAEKAYAKREFQLKAVSKRAYELRYAFVKDFSAAKKYAAEIHRLAFNQVIRYGGAELDIALKLFDIEKPDGERWDSAVQEAKRAMLLEKYREQPERTMLIAVYAAFDDKPSNSYFRAQSWNLTIEYEKNGRLDALYEGLVALGYEMSDEERALQDGTHELFLREQEA